MGGTGIGLGASEPPEKIRENSGGLIHQTLPRVNEGPGLFTSGSFEK